MRMPMNINIRRKLSAISANKSGVALIEFAYCLPVFLGFGACAIEVTNLTLARMRVSQIAMTLADNATRVGVNSGLSQKQVFESDIYDIFEGLRQQAGSLNINGRGRVVLSSLQRNAGGGQWIAWQRCTGSKSFTPSYGAAGTGRTVNTYAGMGPAGGEIQAPAGGAVMYVEIAYDYRALMEPIAQGMTYFGMNLNNQTLLYRAAYIVRDARVLGDSTVNAATATEDHGLFQNATPLTRLTC
jgi:Flp pilus assembly protein TadG